MQINPVRPDMLARAMLRPWALALYVVAAAGAVHAAPPQALDASMAQQALARGAVAWDLREAPATPLLPGALRLDAAAVRAWLDRGDVAALSAAASAAGLNLAGEVLIYGDSDDTRAAAVAAQLATVSRGRVHWLAGGIAPWLAAGLPSSEQPARRLPLPQRLSVIAPLPAVAAPADAARRSSASFSFALPTLARAGS